MAELRRRPGAISKGMKLPITIEDAIEDVLVVCLEYGAKLFKGVLLDVNKRNLPHGICTPFSGNNNDKSKGDPNVEVNNTESDSVEISATNFRNTFTQGSGQPLHNVHLFSKSNKDRPSRNIRLRPRSTLCSKCKAVCQETEKGIIPVTQIVKQHNTQKPQLPQTSLREGLRRRVQNKDAKTGDQTKTTDKNSVTKSSPFIKISIGEGTVLKIPPRLHDEVDGALSKNKTKPEKVEEEKPEVSNDGDKNKRTSKRNLRKTKDRDKKTEINEEVKKEVENNSANVPSHHKKHKRKHKHRHENDGRSGSNEGVDENVESVCRKQCEVVAQRPRLLYTWRQNKGLSPRRENTTNNIENVEKSPKQTITDQVSPKRNVRTRSVEHVQKKEYKLRSRERLSIENSQNTKTSPKTEENDNHDENEDTVISNDVTSENGNEENLPELIMSVSEEPTQDYNVENGAISPPLADTVEKSQYYENFNEKSPEYFINYTGNEDYVVTLNDTLNSSLMNTSSESHEKYVIIDTDKYSVISSASERDFDMKDEDLAVSPVIMSSSSVLISSPDQKHSEDEDVEEEMDDIEDAPPTNDDVFRSLMMKIRTHDVPKCMATDGRTIHVGDIVWGKIKGFPWWPGRVLSISVSERDSGVVIRKLAHVSWFGSSTMSHIQCSDLYPFLEDFKLRYNRKKKGTYKVAIKQATIAAQSNTNTHHIDFKEYDL